jgi:imidazolonepropionase-like amidohydrolase
MILKAPGAMVAEVGDADQAGVGARGELIVKLRELLSDTRDYRQHRAEFERAQRRPYVATRADLEAMIPVLEGREPLLVSVDRASDIREAMQIGKDFGIKVIIGGGAEAWMLADDLAKAKIPVLTGAMNNIPSSFAALGTRQESAAILRKAGVDVAIIGNAGGGDEETLNARNVRYEAGNAVAYGMTWDDALRAVTLAPAQIYGVSDRVGSLQPGREGNVVIWSGDPFDFATRAEQVFVRGKKYDAPTRQDLLTQRYKTLPPNYEAH